MARPNVLNPIYESRREIIISSTNGKSTTRVAHFLRPCSKSPSQAAEFPKTAPLLSEKLSTTTKKWPVKVQLVGWKKPKTEWTSWFLKLTRTYSITWTLSSILDGILSSFHEIPCNIDLILGLSEFWCSETNTFVFPWGEATITLEDVMFLGGLPSLGEPVGCELEEGEFAGVIVEELKKVQKKLSSGPDKKATYGAWLKYFMEEGDKGELEHAAFLSYWLSRFVFPDINEHTIGEHVFPIAARLTQPNRLTQRNRIALAPAVLASLYKNLTLLTKKALDSGASESTICVPGPFQLVQLWACERFPLFGAKLVKPLRTGDIWAARWDKVNVKVTLSHVRSALASADNFKWRPYTVILENWDKNDDIDYHKKTEQYVSERRYIVFPFDEKEERVPIDSCLADDLQCYNRFIHCRMLVGIDGCQEKYQPHRVAMQFGLDQDIPGQFFVFESLDDVEFYVPPRDFEPGVSEGYYNWWKECILARKDSVSHVLEACSSKKPLSQNVADSVQECDPDKQKSGTSERHASVDLSVPPGFKKIRSHKHSSTKKNDDGSTVSRGPVIDEAYDDLDHVPLAVRLSSTASLNLETPKVVKTHPLVAPECQPGFTNLKSQLPCDKDNIIDSYHKDPVTVPLASRLNGSLAAEEPGLSNTAEGQSSNSVIPQQSSPTTMKGPEVNSSNPSTGDVSLQAQSQPPISPPICNDDVCESSTPIKKSKLSNGPEDDMHKKSMSDAASSGSKFEKGKEVDEVAEACYCWMDPYNRGVLTKLSKGWLKAQKRNSRKDGDCVDNPIDVDGSSEETPTGDVPKEKIEMMEGFLASCLD